MVLAVFSPAPTLLEMQQENLSRRRKNIPELPAASDRSETPSENGN